MVGLSEALWLLALPLPGITLGAVAIRVWVWLGTRSDRVDSGETARLARLEAEVAELRDLVTDAILNKDDRAAARLAGRSASTNVDA